MADQLMAALNAKTEGQLTSVFGGLINVARQNSAAQKQSGLNGFENVVTFAARAQEIKNA